MAHYEMQILTGEGSAKTWRSVHATYRDPYKYETEKEARRMIDICYPNLIDGETKRVILVND